MATTACAKFQFEFISQQKKKMIYDIAFKGCFLLHGNNVIPTDQLRKPFPSNENMYNSL